MLKLLFILSIFSGSTMASGGGEGHVTDLIAPFVNILILASFLIWKLKTPMNNYFKKKSADISEVMERAAIKSREAEMMLKMQQTKLDKLNDEVSLISKEAETQINSFKMEYENSIEERIKTLKSDASQKIETEKKEMMDKVNSRVLDEVIARAKKGVVSNEALSKNITDNLIQG